jgi:molybdopterin-guanine dinucleotide biosynthesis protein A
MTTINSQQVTALILAGGMGKRMGGQDKGQVQFLDQPLIHYVIEAIRPQVATILISANRNQELYAKFGYPVIRDLLQDYQGPLAGFSAGLRTATTSHIVTLPCDGPLLPADLVVRLISALNTTQAEISVAHDGTRLQPVYAVIPVRLLNSLEKFLASGQRKIDFWYAEHTTALADFSDVPQTFFNINTPDDRLQLEQMYNASRSEEP